jgi:hypothetical protein
VFSQEQSYQELCQIFETEGFENSKLQRTGWAHEAGSDDDVNTMLDVTENALFITAYMLLNPYT